MGKLSNKTADYFWDRSEKGNGFVNPFIFDTTDGVFASSGLTQRELFAAMAMQGLLSNTSIAESASIIDDYAKAAVLHADALMKALNEPQSDQGKSES